VNSFSTAHQHIKGNIVPQRCNNYANKTSIRNQRYLATLSRWWKLRSNSAKSQKGERSIIPMYSADGTSSFGSDTSNYRHFTLLTFSPLKNSELWQRHTPAKYKQNWYTLQYKLFLTEDHVKSHIYEHDSVSHVALVLDSRQ